MKTTLFLAAAFFSTLGLAQYRINNFNNQGCTGAYGYCTNIKVNTCCHPSSLSTHFHSAQFPDIPRGTQAEIWTSGNGRFCNTLQQSVCSQVCLSSSLALSGSSLHPNFGPCGSKDVTERSVNATEKHECTGSATWDGVVLSDGHEFAIGKGTPAAAVAALERYMVAGATLEDVPVELHQYQI